jgi:hypothetical protein
MAADGEQAVGRHPDGEARQIDNRDRFSANGMRDGRGERRGLKCKAIDGDGETALARLAQAVEKVGGRAWRVWGRAGMIVVKALLGGAHQRASGAKQPDTGAPSDDIPVLVAAEEPFGRGPGLGRRWRVRLPGR